MPTPSDEPLEGPDAAEIIASDPFWSVVRRRHPDIDIVVLPPDDAPDLTPAPGATPVHTGAARAEFEADVTALWGLLGRAAGGLVVRWTVAPNRGAVALEGRIVDEDVAPEDARAALRRAADRLSAEGWHVLAPMDGMPRVAAGQIRGAGRRTAQVVYVAAQSRLLLIVRSEAIPVSRNTANTLLGSSQ